MSADQHRHVVTGDVEDDLAFITLVLVDRTFHSQRPEDLLDRVSAGIGDRIELIIGQLYIFTGSVIDIRLIVIGVIVDIVARVNRPWLKSHADPCRPATRPEEPSARLSQNLILNGVLLDTHLLKS